MNIFINKSPDSPEQKTANTKCTKFSKKIVILCISFIILYTIAQIIMNYILGVEISPTLTTCVYAFFGTELASCAFIKVLEKKDNETMQDEQILDNEPDIDIE